MLSVENLAAAYGKSRVLHDVNLQAQPGRITCLLGRNGAGKSTTLKCLMGLLPPQSGSVRIGGDDITRLPPHRIARRGIGYVPETRMIFPNLTVRENLSMGLWQGGNALPGATERVLEYFPRLAEKLGARGATLSGGEQQMLSIGRALMAAPRCLVVDEPMEGLAPVIVQALERSFKALAASGTTLLIADSKLAAASRIADWIFVMGKGRTVFAGTVAALEENQNIRREYLEV